MYFKPSLLTSDFLTLNIVSRPAGMRVDFMLWRTKAWTSMFILYEQKNNRIEKNSSCIFWPIV